MRTTTFWALSILALLTTTCGADGRGGKQQAPKELYQQMLAARVACDAADDTLFANMQKAGDKFADLCAKRGFPKNNRDLSAIENALYVIANENPYAKDPILAQEVETHFPQARTQLNIECDGSLSEPYVRQVTQFPPATWHAVPGSLNILHNERDLILVWAAGIDGNPLKDKSDYLRVVCIRVTAHR